MQKESSINSSRCAWLQKSWMGCLSKSSLLIVVARPTDVGVQDRRSLRGALARGTPVKVVVEDGFDRAVGPRADVDGAFGGGFQSLGAMGTREPDDAQTGAKALLGMWSRLKDQFAQGRRRRPDQARVGADALDRPAGIAPMAGRHVLGDGGVLVVAAGAHMRGDPAIRSPLRKISTVRTVSRASTSAR